MSAVARSIEKNLLAVRSPSHKIVAAGMPGDAPGLASLHGHHEDIDIAVVLGGESDVLAVWRKLGTELIS